MGPGSRCRRQTIPSLHDTITRLKALRQRGLDAAQPISGTRLVPFEDLGSNPGNLNAWSYVPDSLRKGAPLVVVLHGCTQTAAGYDHGTGWSRAADEYGFALLFPEQQRANNPNLCFNWFSPDDAARDQGEASSIRQAVAAMQALHETDPAQVFVTGLSAGGAMAAVMLATYPDVFAGGAVIAGLPYGTAQSVPEAFERMRGAGGSEGEALGALVRSASTHSGPWPTLSVWHGTGDSTVDHSNAEALVDQWRALHGAPKRPSRTGKVNGYPHRMWSDAHGRAVIEEYTITGMAHGTPLSTSEADSGEVAGAYMLEAGISSTRLIADFWGIARKSTGKRAKAAPSRPATAPSPTEAAARPSSPPPPRRSNRTGGSVRPEGGVQKVIDDALRAAGLLR